MYLSFFLNLAEGAPCRIKDRNHPYYGEIVRFQQIDYVMQCPLYVFEAADQQRIVLICESDFETVPYQASVRILIDLALQTRDECWFRSLVRQLEHATL